MGMSSKNRRALMNALSATWTEADFVRFRKAKDAYEEYVRTGPLDPRRFPADPVVLCLWCREQHLASEVRACMALPRAIEKVNANGSSMSSAGPGKLLAQYPELLAFLSATSYPDGKRRQTG